MEHILVVPCYNEAARWDADYWHGMANIEGVRWVFVDDGSTDETAALIEELCARCDSAGLMRLQGNRGKAEAVRLGLLDALGAGSTAFTVGFLDADGAFRPHDVARLLSLVAQSGEATGSDAVWSSRVALSGRDIHRSSARHYIGRFVETFLAVGQPELPYDTQSGFKVFRPSDTLSACLAAPFRTRWLFEVELLSRWFSLTGKPMAVWEEPLHSWRDITGSRITVREATRIAGELLVVKRLQVQTARRVASRETEGHLCDGS